MTTQQAVAAVRGIRDPFRQLTLPNWQRMLIASVIVVLAITPGNIGVISRGSIVDAYIQVSVFVAATLFFIYGAERLFRLNVAEVMARSRFWQVPVAAALGATPGCGGAVFVVAAYSRRTVSFGSVMAALTATMGDAAFLLLATRPSTGVSVIAITFTVGLLSGWFVDVFLTDPLRARPTTRALIPLIGSLRKRDIACAALAVPGLVLGVLALAQTDLEALFGITANAVALCGASLALMIWILSPVKAATRTEEHVLTRVSEETSFITVWVIVAFLLYEISAGPFGLDLSAVTAAAAPIVPLLAILVGFVPGCGPQVLMTALYLNGVLPFSALIGNAISNDGDALFPALAVDWKAAWLATLYSAVPAAIVAYGCYFLDIHL